MARDNSRDEDSDIDPTMWMVTFGDLLMLLLTFFVMLLTMKSMDTKTLKSMFSIFEGGCGVLEFCDLSTIKPIQKEGDLLSLKPPDLEMLDALNSRLNKLLAQNLDRRVGNQEMLEDLLATEDELGNDEFSDELNDLIDISEDERGVIMTFPESTLFDSGQAEIKPAMYPLLNTIARMLAVVSNEILIMGHTDNVPVRSERYRSNWELSMYRALNVHQYLVQEKDLSPGRLAVGGYGDLRPQFPNDAPEGRERNRRIELILRRME